MSSSDGQRYTVVIFSATSTSKHTEMNQQIVPYCGSRYNVLFILRIDQHHLLICLPTHGLTSSRVPRQTLCPNCTKLSSKELYDGATYIKALIARHCLNQVVVHQQAEHLRVAISTIAAVVSILNAASGDKHEYRLVQQSAGNLQRSVWLDQHDLSDTRLTLRAEGRFAAASRWLVYCRPYSLPSVFERLALHRKEHSTRLQLIAMPSASLHRLAQLPHAHQSIALRVKL
eukprot:9958-Heterococcus_DN1.PRE.3